MNVAVIGASNDRRKFGNKSLRAHLRQGYQVFPVNPSEDTIEGIPAYKSVCDVPVELDRVTVYLPPEKTLQLLDDIAKKGAKELFLNPGSENAEALEKARDLGLEPIVACSIVDIGETPSSFR